MLTAVQGSGSPVRIAMLFLPEFGAAVLTAAPFGALFRTRFTPVLAISGLAVLAAGAALLTGLTAGASALVAVAAALVGFGVGASVSPALFLAGFSVALRADPAGLCPHRTAPRRDRFPGRRRWPATGN